MNRRPGNSYRTSTQASSVPNTALASAAISDAPNVSRYAASARSVVASCQKSAQDSSSARSTSPQRESARSRSGKRA